MDHANHCYIWSDKFCTLNLLEDVRVQLPMVFGEDKNTVPSCVDHMIFYSFISHSKLKFSLLFRRHNWVFNLEYLLGDFGFVLYWFSVGPHLVRHETLVSRLKHRAIWSSFMKCFYVYKASKLNQFSSLKYLR